MKDRPPDLHKNDPPRQLHNLSIKMTPTHEVPAKPNQSFENSDQLVISSQLPTGKNGVQTNPTPPPTNQTLNRNINDSFPKISSNFEPPSKLSNQMHKQAKFTPIPLPARPNATETSQPAFPTIQQLNARFNHHSTTKPQTNYKATTSTEPSPPTVVPTFASKLRTEHPPVPTIQLSPTKKTTKQGYPAVIFKRDDFMVKLAERCKYTVIGKFSYSMPKLELIRSSLTSQLQLKGSLKVTHFNSRHIYIDLDNEYDHATVWHKEKIYVEGRVVRLFVWTPTFKPDQETPIAPVWIILPQLPWHCYCMEMVSELLDPVGKALFLDAATFQKTRGSVAKVKLELDLSKPRPKYVWLGYDEDEFGEGQWQEIQYENVPDYCMYCKHQGHSEHTCTIKSRDIDIQRRKEEVQADEPMTGQANPKVQIPSNNQKTKEHLIQPNKATSDSNREHHGTKPQAKPQAMTAARKTDLKNSVKQVYVPKMAAQLTVDNEKSPAEVPHANDSLVGQESSTDTMRVSNLRTMANTKNSFDVLIDVDSNVATGNTIKKVSAQTGPVQDVLNHGNAVNCASDATDVTVSGLQCAFPASALDIALVPCEVGVQNLSPKLHTHNQLHDIVLQGNENALDTAGISQRSLTPAVVHNDPAVVEQQFASVVKGRENTSTKDWVLKSFAPVDAMAVQSKKETNTDLPLSVNEHELATVGKNAGSATGAMQTCSNAKSVATQSTSKTEHATDIECPDFDFDNIKHNSASKGTATGKKKKKKHDNLSVSTEALDPDYAIPMGRDYEETEKDKALAVYVPPVHSGNKLIPTATLEAICKEASKAIKEVGRGFYRVTSQAEFNNEGIEAPAYLLGDLFDDSQNDQTTPSKIGKSKWNLNAPLFIPNALRQQESQVATDNVDSQKVHTLEFPNAPSDEVLLKNLDLHDIRGLLQRQNSPPQELPHKFSSAHPGIIEDGSEYEDEDEESTAYNYMEESRHAGLSPRLDQVRKPKLIKKKRRPLELKKKEEAPKEPKRVQPTRSSKSKSARANYAAKRL